ncbi:hypothetical protein LTR09_006437 [Extremus antarcticus]|uniref:Uncharacterized protein n=1 Tax=Extremus antarcticus TaxID=702011 RepID=A0AAJ0DEP4_9PEZI|nr:hypothetical protein LTR09_006437 [Extremus antarcticus]
MEPSIPWLADLLGWSTRSISRFPFFVVLSKALRANLRADGQHALGQLYCSAFLSIPSTTQTVTISSTVTEQATSTETTTVITKGKPKVSTITVSAVSTTTSTVTETTVVDLGPSTETEYIFSTLCQNPNIQQSSAVQKREEVPTEAVSIQQTPPAFSTLTDPAAVSSACSCLQIPTSRVKETTTLTLTKTAAKPTTTTTTILATSHPTRLTTTTLPGSDIITETTTTTTIRNPDTVTVTSTGDPVYPSTFHIAISNQYMLLDRSTNKISYSPSFATAERFTQPLSSSSNLTTSDGALLLWAGIDDSHTSANMLPVIFIDPGNTSPPPTESMAGAETGKEDLGWYPVSCKILLGKFDYCSLSCGYGKGKGRYADRSYVISSGRWYLGNGKVREGKGFSVVSPRVYAA